MGAHRNVLGGMHNRKLLFKRIQIKNIQNMPITSILKSPGGQRTHLAPPPDAHAGGRHPGPNVSDSATVDGRGRKTKLYALTWAPRGGEGEMGPFIPPGLFNKRAIGFFLFGII